MNSLRLQRAAPNFGTQPSARDFYFLISALCSLISKRIALRLLRRIRAVQRLAKLAAVNLRFPSDNRSHFFRIVVPPLQMPGAQFSFLVLFVAGALFRFARFNLWSDCRFFCHGVLSTNRGRGKKF